MDWIQSVNCHDMIVLFYISLNPIGINEFSTNIYIYKMHDMFTWTTSYLTLVTSFTTSVFVIHWHDLSTRLLKILHCNSFKNKELFQIIKKERKIYIEMVLSILSTDVSIDYSIYLSFYFNFYQQKYIFFKHFCWKNIIYQIYFQ